MKGARNVYKIIAKSIAVSRFGEALIKIDIIEKLKSLEHTHGEERVKRGEIKKLMNQHSFRHSRLQFVSKLRLLAIISRVPKAADLPLRIKCSWTVINATHCSLSITAMCKHLGCIQIYIYTTIRRSTDCIT